MIRSCIITCNISEFYKSWNVSDKNPYFTNKKLKINRVNHYKGELRVGFLPIYIVIIHTMQP